MTGAHKLQVLRRYQNHRSLPQTLLLCRRSQRQRQKQRDRCHAVCVWEARQEVEVEQGAFTISCSIFCSSSLHGFNVAPGPFSPYPHLLFKIKRYRNLSTPATPTPPSPTPVSTSTLPKSSITPPTTNPTTLQSSPAQKPSSPAPPAGTTPPPTPSTTKTALFPLWHLI